MIELILGLFVYLLAGGLTGEIVWGNTKDSSVAGTAALFWPIVLPVSIGIAIARKIK